MPKVKISEYSATANSNTDVASINIDEGCAPSGINNAIRAVMGHLKDFQQGTYGDPFNGPVNGTLGATTAATANVTTLTTSSTVTHNGGTANGVAYLNGSKVLTTGSALVFDGTTFTAGTATSQNGVFKTVIGSGGANEGAVIVSGTTGTGWLGFNNGNNANIPGQITYNHSTGALSLYANSGPVIFSASGTEGMRLASGNLGIGTTSPVGPLTVRANSSARGIVAAANAANPDFVGIEFLQSDLSTLYGAVSMEQTNMRFITGSTERARIDTSGNLLVGRTTTANTTVGSGLYSYGLIASSQSASTNANTSYDLYSTGAAAYRFYVGMGGTIYATSTTISAISDIRFKENVRDLDAGLSEVMALKPRLYDWKEGKGADIKNARGFIAQEFEEVFPDLIDEWKDPAPEGEEPYKSVRQDLIPVLVKAIQELKAEIDSLKSQLNGA